ncbi:MAG: hypothetical protein Q8P22_07965 [Chloroflexota bacterium]|nr:hypothetical protein [Chloroflexota bacterium]
MAATHWLEIARCDAGGVLMDLVTGGDGVWTPPRSIRPHWAVR